MEPSPVWIIIDNSFAFLFSLLATLLLTFLTWRVMSNFLLVIVGKGMSIIGAGLSALLVLATGLKIANDFLVKARSIHILQGLIAGVVDTVDACISPKVFSPLELILLVSFGLYLCYWLHTRFVPKHTTDDLRQKVDRAIEPEEPKKPTYPY